MRRWSDIADDLLLVTGLIVLFMVPHAITSDGLVRFNALRDCLAYNSFPDCKFSMIGPVLSVPFLWIGSAISTPERWCRYFNWVVMVLFVIGLESLLKGQVDRGLRRKVQLLLVAGSMFAVQQKDYFAEVLNVVGVMLGFLAIQQRRWWGSALIAFGAANVPATIPATGLVILFATWQTRRLRYLLIGVGIVGIVMLENTLRRGFPLVTGYESDFGLKTLLPYSGRPGFSYPFGFGLMSVLFSFGKGLVFFAPGLVLPYRDNGDQSSRSFKPLYVAGMIFTIGLVLTYSRWWAWYGGWCWGPRFFLGAAVPSSIALAVWLTNNRSITGDIVGIACLALACWVGFTGAVCGQCDLVPICCNDYFANEHLTWYVPEFSVLWRPLLAGGTWKIKPPFAAVYWVMLCAWLSGPVIYRMAARLRLIMPRISRTAFSSWRW